MSIEPTRIPLEQYVAQTRAKFEEVQGMMRVLSEDYGCNVAIMPSHDASNAARFPKNVIKVSKAY